MGLLCSVAGHLASDVTISNEGYQFSSCTRCGIDLVQSGDDRWIAPPHGYRIVKQTLELRAKLKTKPQAEAQESGRGLEQPAILQEKRRTSDRRAADDDNRPPALRGVDRRRRQRREEVAGVQSNRRKGLLAK
jgi:uncharacterized Zn finger protein (UPF0148 family)